MSYDIQKAIGDKISEVVSDLLPKVPLPQGQLNNLVQLASNDNAIDDANIWSPKEQDWYKVFPYRFLVQKEQVVKKNGKKFQKTQKFYYTLPIPPQAMTTKMLPASQVTPTIGGVVEETSDNLFWIIQLRGTTGIAVSRGKEGAVGRATVAKKFRDKIETTGLLSGIAANLGSVASKIGSVVDAAASGAIFDAISGAINNAILPPLPYAQSAVSNTSNGFSEMHELHKFFYAYSKLKGLYPGRYSLWFEDLKNDQRFQIILQDFTIERTSQSPHLYRYSIQMQGWGVLSARRAGVKVDKLEYDRFGKGGDLANVNTVGVTQLFKAFQGFKDNFNIAASGAGSLFTTGGGT